MRTFDFIKPELDFIKENANFTPRQREIFKRLTGEEGRQKIYQIAMEMNMSDKTVSREIAKIDFKITKLFLFKRGLM